MPKRFTQEELNDLIRDLSFSKELLAFLASFFRNKSYMHYRNMEKIFCHFILRNITSVFNNLKKYENEQKCTRKKSDHFFHIQVYIYMQMNALNSNPPITLQEHVSFFLLKKPARNDL